MSYEKKFATLIEMCQDAEREGLDVVVIPEPQVLGDTYAEIIESLNRISDADFKIAIIPRAQRYGTSKTN